jgi:hypothetical protein
MKFQLVLCVLMAVSLGACNTPSPGFMGIEAQTVTVGSSTFDVRRRGDQVELLRTNPEAVFSLKGVLPRASDAVIQVTGCTPNPGTWIGDHNMMQVQIDCAD